MKNFIANWRSDLPSSLVVFLVALPLCLGVGLASTNIEGMNGMPNVFSGIIAGIIGGIVVGTLSGSRAGVSGPAAGLITIVLVAIVTLGSFEAFLVAVVIAGIIQLVAGFAGLGIIGNYFPSSVIKGMLAAIGITLILKEIPHAVGYDKDFFGDEAFIQADGHNTFSELMYAMGSLNGSAILIAVISIAIMILFERKFIKKIKLFQFIPAALIVVLVGIGINLGFKLSESTWTLEGEHLVSLPRAANFNEFIGFLSFPDFSFLTNPNIYVIAITIALIGSLETLLSVEATDKLDPEKYMTPTNRELKAQGVGNIISGLIGGLPITQVIVRSSANINAGAKSKVSAIVHGALLMITVIFIPHILNLIPLASLAAILIMIGYKLAKVKLFQQLYKQGWDQFLPFCATIIGVLLTDLLMGIGIGIAFAIFFILKKNYHNNFIEMESDKDGKIETVLTLSEEVSFLNKAGFVNVFSNIQDGSILIIDGTKSKTIDFDVLELIHEFKQFGAKEKNVDCRLINIPVMSDEGSVDSTSEFLTWKEVKSTENWAKLIEFPKSLEDQIIILELKNNEILKTLNSLLESLPKTQIVVLKIGNIDVFNSQVFDDFKAGLTLLKSKNIRCNLVGLSEKSKNQLIQLNLIPNLVHENNAFNEFTNCMLNMSFDIENEANT